MRLFLACEIPAPVRRRIAEASRALAGGYRGWRWVAEDALHVTLRFLGEVEPSRLPQLGPRFRAGCGGHPSIEVRFSGVGVFPTGGRPRILFARIDEPLGGDRLAALAADLEAGARALGFEPEERPFRSHLTLARAARDARPSAPPPDAVGDLGTVRFDRVVLFESTLLPGGARHRAVEVYPLAGGAELHG